MEEVIESTFSLLSSHHEHGSALPGTEKALEPIHLLALLDIRAAWFKKWMVCVCVRGKFSTAYQCFHHGLLFVLYSVSYVSLLVCPLFPAQHGYYSRTVVLRLLERKYKSLVSDSLSNQYLSQTPLYFSGVRTQKETTIETSLQSLAPVIQ